MKKNTILFASLLASLFIAGSCQKYDVKEAVEENAKVSTLTVNATLAAAEGEGMKTVIASDDVLRVRFVDANGNVVGRTQMLANKSGENASVTFSADNIAIPDGAQKIIAFLDNRTDGKINYGSTPTKADFSAQDGTLKNAQGLQIISGEAAVGSNVSIDLKYATTIVKAVVSFPEDVEPLAGATTITLALGEYDSVVIDNAIVGAKGNITVDAKVDETAKTASAYIAVIADGLQDGTLLANIGSTKYGCDIAAEDVAAGKTFSVNEELAVLVYSFYIPDEEYTIDVTGEKVSGDDFITVSGGKLTVAENKTGKVRTGSVVLDNGKEYVFKQIGPNEFKGSWTFKAKFFSNNTSVATAGNNKEATVTFGDPLGGVETLEDFDGVSHTNNIGITGLYGTAVMNATVEINYDTQDIRLGIFFDLRKAQKISVSNKAGYEYVCFLPEMGTGSNLDANWTSPWNFLQVKLDDEKNYCWLWFKVNEDLSQFAWNSFSKEESQTMTGRQFMTGSLATSANCLIGITCALSKSEKVDKDNVLGANTNADYNVIYQANTNNDTKVPMSFTRN